MKIGLLMLRDENDIVVDTLAGNSQLVDCFYVLDGSDDYKTSEGICQGFSNCAGYWRDCEVPYPEPPVDGWRQFLYEKATNDHGHDHWFLLLHGDELWVNHPDDAIADVPDADGFEFRLPFAIPRGWDDARTAYDQLREFAFPGWPEFRMFKGSEDVAYDPSQHFRTSPNGLERVARLNRAILHYPYRSLASQKLRASKSAAWSPENYETIGYWDDDRLREVFADSEHYSYAATLKGL